METFQDELERDEDDEEEEEEKELVASMSEDESLRNRNDTESFEKKTSDKQGRKRGKPSGVGTPTKIPKYDQEAKVQIIFW